jgi:hypothetical protein
LFLGRRPPTPTRTEKQGSCHIFQTDPPPAVLLNYKTSDLEASKSGLATRFVAECCRRPFPARVVELVDTQVSEACA